MTDTTEKAGAAEPVLLDMEAGRRAFIQALGFGTVGAAVFAAAAGTPAPAEAQGNITDIDILNFALNLEYLEATFYAYANSGADIPAMFTTGPNGEPSGTVTGGKKAALNSALVKVYAAEIADEELRHVQALRILLGANFVARPNLNIGTAFATAAVAAGIPNGASFSPYSGDAGFLLGAYIFEDVGVTAYHGAARMIRSGSTLNYAAGILATEAYHAGIIRTSLFAMQNPNIMQATQRISELRSTLSTGAKYVDDLGVGTAANPRLACVSAPNATMFTEVQGGDAICYSRSTAQVLNIVYGNAPMNGQARMNGLFFPNGMNGTIK